MQSLRALTVQSAEYTTNMITDIQQEIIKLKKEKKKDFVCDGCGKGYIGASRNSFIIRVAGYETYNIQLCNACLLSLKKKINKEENE